MMCFVLVLRPKRPLGFARTVHPNMPDGATTPTPHRQWGLMGVLKRSTASHLTIAVALCAGALAAQSIRIRIYSEFDRLNAAGGLVETTPGRDPLEILSPAVVRNGYATFHVAVTARPGVLYWFAVQSNPPEAFRIRVYKESPGRGSAALVMDHLTEEAKPLYFLGIMPDSPGPTATDVYLLDIRVPRDMPVGTIRLEAMVKEAYWTVAPMEVRVLPARVPDLDWQFRIPEMPRSEEPADTFAWDTLLTGFTDSQLPSISPSVDVRSVIRRNAIQDAALIRSLGPMTRQELLSRIFTLLTLTSPTGFLRPTTSAEVYLPIRRLIYTSASRPQH